MGTTGAGAGMKQGAIGTIFAALIACGIAAAVAQPVPARTEPSPSAVDPGQSAAEQLRALLDEDLAAVFRRFPLFATVRGVPGYNHLLRDLSPAARERERADERRRLARLQAIDAGALRGQDRVSLELLLDKMQSAVSGQRFVNSDALVLSTLGGIQNEMPRAAQITPFRTVDDYRDYIRRLSAMPRLAEQTIEQLGAGVVRGMTAAQIHALGLREVERLRHEIGQIRQRTGVAGTTDEFIHHLRTDPRFFFTSPEAVLTAYRAMAQRVDPQLGRLFHAMPRMPYAVRGMTASEAASSTAANYISGSLALGTSGYFTINALGYANEATWRVETLFLHEAVPGHHMQIARAAEIDSLHLWRRMAGGNVAYWEGWALYAEKLGFELGLFKDPYQHYGHVQAELFRAARLVVDTGIHAYSWPRARAVEYMATQAGVDHAFAVSEVDRYFSNPTQALGYMLGQRKFLELRARAEQALGAGFDIRDFHAAVIDNGPVSLPVLEKLVDEWIASSATHARDTVIRDSVPMTAVTSLATVVVPSARVAEEVDPHETRRLHALFDRRWEAVLQFDPEFATFVGDHRYGERLRDASPGTIAATYAAARRTLDEAKAIRRIALSPNDQVSLDIFVYLLQEFLHFQAFAGYRSMSMGALWGFQTDSVPLPVLERSVDAWIAELSAGN